MAHTYSHLYGLPPQGCAFSRSMVPGPARHALFLFTDAIRNGRPIDVFNQGAMVRDFTYIDDIVEGVIRVLDKTATPDPDF